MGYLFPATDPDLIIDYVLNLNTIFPIPGSHKKYRRLGRGTSAGQGGSCGKGQHGQNSRSGLKWLFYVSDFDYRISSGGGTRPGFEGGQTPLYRRIPKYVGRTMRGHTKTEYALIQLRDLNSVTDGSVVDYASLLATGTVSKVNKGLDIFKVVGGAELKVKNLKVRAHAFTKSARTAIEANGGECVLLSHTRHIPLAEAQMFAREKKSASLVKLKALRALKAKREEEKSSSMV